MKFIFDIDFHGEPEAGITGYTDTVSIEVESGDPGGEYNPGDFVEHMMQALSEWFDGASVQLRATKAKAPPDFLSQALNEGDGTYKP